MEQCLSLQPTTAVTWVLDSLAMILEFVRLMEPGLIHQPARVCEKELAYSRFHIVFAPIIIIVDCGGLSDPANGNVTLTDTLLGSTATYTCNSGYSLVGDVSVVCQANAAGSWSGTANCSGIMFTF